MGSPKGGQAPDVRPQYGEGAHDPPPGRPVPRVPHLVLICGRYAQNFFTAEPHWRAGSHLLVFV